MARLVLCLDGNELAEYNMTKERYTIGRLPDNDIRLDHPGVSGHHALVINILDDSFLEDLNSTNGTTVNGRRIAKHPLQHEDVVRIGRHELRFVDEHEEQLESDEFERTMVLNTMSDSPANVEALVKRAVADSSLNQIPSARPTPPSAPAPRASSAASAAARSAAREFSLDEEPAPSPPPERTPPTPPAAPTPRPRVDAEVEVSPRVDRAPNPNSLPLGKIQVLSGSFAGKELELSKALTTLGRPGIQVAAISRRAEGYFIVHVESGKPNDFPKLNGEEIGPKAHALRDRDVIQLAGVKMGFFLV
ncbi:MAG: FHA domain-containing protein [Pseudomonadota bacterium]